MQSKIFVIFSMLVPGLAMAQQTLVQRISNPDWSCGYEFKGALPPQGKGLGASSIGVSNILCVNRTTNERISNSVICPLDHGGMPSPEQCVSQAQDPNSAIKLKSLDSAFMAKSENSSLIDKYGRKCEYDTETKNARAILRTGNEGNTEVTCFTPLICDSQGTGPKHNFAACTPNSKDGKNNPSMSQFKSCPQAVDCINNGIDLKQVSNASDLAKLDEQNASAPTVRSASSRDSSVSPASSGGHRKK